MKLVKLLPLMVRAGILVEENSLVSSSCQELEENGGRNTKDWNSVAVAKHNEVFGKRKAESDL